MSDAADDLEALFDDISAARLSEPMTATAPAGEPVAEEAQQEARHEVPAVAPEDQSMYERLGGIVRMLHDSLRALGYDRSLSEVASQIQDSRGRLEYVATLTEQAANKVLNAVDNGMPEQEMLAKEAKDMDSRWAALFAGKLSIEEFKVLAGDSKEFATMVAEATDSERARLLDIMMAQDFQDITGQLIKKIVAITHAAERELTQLLRDNAPPEIKAAIAEQKPTELMQGPSAPGTAMDQDDVDSMLADLGF